jgi:hypothetical protein
VKSATGTNPKNQLKEIPDMRTDRKDAMHVLFSWTGMELRVLVVVLNYEPDLEDHVTG